MDEYIYCIFKQEAKKEKIDVIEAEDIGKDYIKIKYGIDLPSGEFITNEIVFNKIETSLAEAIRQIKTKELKPKKPPLGITPHFIWIEQRMEEIRQAINRRIEAKEIIPSSWYIELAQLENERLKNTNYLVVDNSNFDIEMLKAIMKEGI